MVLCITDGFLYFDYGLSVAKLTLQWHCGLNSNYCPVWRGFIFVVLLNAFMTVQVTKAGTEGLRDGEKTYYRLLLNNIKWTVQALNSLIP